MHNLEHLHTKEVADKIGIAHKGKKLTLQHKQNISKAVKIRHETGELVIPKYDTKIEIKLQTFLNVLVIGFFKHLHKKEITHGYQCDIEIPVQRNKDRFIKHPIILEADGDYWHNYPEGYEIDRIRTKELQEQGFRVIRLWEHEINKMNLDEFKNIILNNQEVKNETTNRETQQL